MPEHYTQESEGKVGTITTPEEARKAHHLASADPDYDGPLTGPAHEAKYGLERAEASAAVVAQAGVDPHRNGALDTTEARKAQENTDAPRAKRQG